MTKTKQNNQTNKKQNKTKQQQQQKTAKKLKQNRPREMYSPVRRNTRRQAKTKQTHFFKLILELVFLKKGKEKLKLHSHVSYITLKYSPRADDITDQEALFVLNFPVGYKLFKLNC